MFEKLPFNVKVIQDLAKVILGEALVDSDSPGVHWDPDLVPISLTVDHVRHKGSHDAGCDNI